MNSVTSILWLVTLVSQQGDISGYSSGAPNSQCGSMTPGHGQTPKDNANSPYQVVLSQTQIAPGAQVTVELKGSESFIGFIVTARDENDNIIGAFETVGSDGKYVTCGGKPQTSVTHVNGNAKSSVLLKWTAPSDFSGNIEILASFVKSYSEYYVKVPASSLQVYSSGGGGFVFPESSSAEPETEPESEAESEPEAEPEAEPEPETEPEPESSGESYAQSSELQKGCGRLKTCMGYPNNCLHEGGCNLIASWRKLNDGDYEWELFQKLGSGNYVAVGLSSDTKMGEDLVMACASSSSVEMFWNSGKSPKLLNTIKGVSNFKFSSEDGGKVCSFTTSEIIQGDDRQVDLSGEHHVLLAGGSYGGPGQLSYHLTSKLATPEPVALALVTNLGGASNLLFRIHGLLMILAWVGCSGAGMILARYFKRTWRGKTVMGKDVWFVLHRLLMTLAVLMSIAAVILILIEVQVEPLAFESLQLNAHPVVGLVCVLLAILQPIMAACRPHPGTSNRRIFNWAHWAVGNSAFLCGVVAIFLAGTLAKANLSSTAWWSWLVLAFVIFHFLVHMILTVVMAKEERSSDITMDHQMADLRGKVDMIEEDHNKEVGSAVRKPMLAVYLIVVWGISIALIVAIFQA